MSTPDATVIDALLAELDGLVGLEPVKEGVRRLVAIHRLNLERVQQGEPIIAQTVDVMFIGEPGTGEDAVAALIGRLYAALGILPDGALHEAGRGELVGVTAEESATRVATVVAAAAGGVLLVDDVEQLLPVAPEDPAAAALAALGAALGARPAPMAMILSGPTAVLDALADNLPAFAPARANALEFPRYTPDQLVAIFERGADELRIEVPAEVQASLLQHFVQVHDGGDFRSARYVPALLGEMYARLATRTMADGTAEPDEHRAFVVADVPPPARAVGDATGIRIGFSGDLGSR
jgi:SpoVK/Ycf46/Vps4 family AAA+-type ATPase